MLCAQNAKCGDAVFPFLLIDMRLGFLLPLNASFEGRILFPSPQNKRWTNRPSKKANISEQSVSLDLGSPYVRPYVRFRLQDKQFSLGVSCPVGSHLFSTSVQIKEIVE